MFNGLCGDYSTTLIMSSTPGSQGKRRIVNDERRPKGPTFQLYKYDDERHNSQKKINMNKFGACRQITQNIKKSDFQEKKFSSNKKKRVHFSEHLDRYESKLYVFKQETPFSATKTSRKIVFQEEEKSQKCDPKFSKNEDSWLLQDSYNNEIDIFEKGKNSLMKRSRIERNYEFDIVERENFIDNN